MSAPDDERDRADERDTQPRRRRHQERLVRAEVALLGHPFEPDAEEHRPDHREEGRHGRRSIVEGDSERSARFPPVVDGDEESFVGTIVGSLADEPADYNEIERIDWGRQQPGGDVEDLELGPNDCAAN